MTYTTDIAWGTLASNVLPYYDSGVFQLNKYSIKVYPLDFNEVGASSISVNEGDYFIDYLGYPWIILSVTDYVTYKKIIVYDINERSLGETVNYGPYPEKIGYIYNPANDAIILSQAQLLKLDWQARDRINNFEKAVLWQNRGISIYNGVYATDNITKIELGYNLALNDSEEDSWNGGNVKILGFYLDGNANNFLTLGENGEIVDSGYSFSTDNTLSNASDILISSTLAIKTYIDNVVTTGSFNLDGGRANEVYQTNDEINGGGA